MAVTERTGSSSCWIGAEGRNRANRSSPNPSACKLHHQSSRSCGYAGHSIDIDCMWPAILWQMEPRIAADQGNVASAGAVNIARFATGHEGFGSNYIWRLTDAAERKLGQLAQVVARRLQA